MSKTADEIDSTTKGGSSQMNDFLTNSLKTKPPKVIEVMGQLQEVGVSYEDFMALSETDLRPVLQACDINPLFVGRIISSLKTTDGATIASESQPKASSPKPPGGFVKIYVSPEETMSFTKLTKALNVTTDAASIIQGAIHQLEENRQATLKAIETAFNVVCQDLEQRKSALNKETNDAAQRKQTVLRVQLENLTKYKDTLKLAESEYHKTLENPQLHDRDRAEKNIGDIDKAINGPSRYDQREPIISPEIAFLFEDDYDQIVDQCREFGNVFGTMKPPTLNISDIKAVGTAINCTVIVEPHEDSEDCPLDLQKFEVKYEGFGAANAMRKGSKAAAAGGGIKLSINSDEDTDSKSADGDEEEKTVTEEEYDPNKNVVEIDVEDDKVVITGLRPETEYKFWARASYDLIGFTPYSEVFIVNTPEGKKRRLTWHRSKFSKSSL